MTMRTVGWALTWEYWRRGTIWLVVATAGLVMGGTALLYAALLGLTGLRYGDLRAELDSALMALVVLPPLVLVTASFAAPRRHHALPVATSLLVISTLVQGALATMCIYWFVALVLRGLFHAAWPLLLPAVWAATNYAVLQSLVWQAGRSRGLFILGVLLYLMCAMPLGVAYLLHHLLPVSDQPARTGVSILGELCLVLAPTWALAYLLGANGMARDRRGDGWSLGWLMRGWQRLTSLLAGVSHDAQPPAFRSPYAAQCWYEWRTKGRVVFWSVLAVLAGLWVWLSFGQRLADIDGMIGGLSAVLLVVSPVVGLYLGSDAGRFDRRVFAATRPLSDGALAAAVVKNAAIVVCSCSAAWLVGIALTATICRVGTNDWQQFQQAWAAGLPTLVRAYAGPTAQLLLLVGCILLGVWTVVGLGASLALARSWFVAVGGCGCAALAVGLLWCWNSGGRFVVAAICLLVTVTAFVAAYRLHVMSNKKIARCGAIYLLFCITSMSAYALTHVEHRPVGFVAFILAGLCAAPWAPLAAAPWALFWNRHR